MKIRAEVVTLVGRLTVAMVEEVTFVCVQGSGCAVLWEDNKGVSNAIRRLYN